MQQPLTPLALAAIAGISLAEYTQPSLPVLLAAGIISVLTFAFSSRARAFSLLLLTATAAALRFVECLQLPALHDLQIAVPTLPAIVAVRGILADSPTQHSSPYKDSTRIHTTAFIDVLELKDGDIWIPSSGKIHASIPGELPTHFFRLQHVEVEGVLQLPKRSDAPGLFDYAEFLRLNNVHRQLLTDGSSDWRLAPNFRSNPTVSDRFLAWGRRVLSRGLPYPNPSLDLIWAMTLGWHPPSSQDFQQSFLQSGTIHVFAISGLHIALICMVFVAILRVLRLPRARCGLLALPTAWAYVGMTGWQPSAIRSALMMSVIIGGWALQRPGNLLNSLSGACLCVLAWQPGQLFLAGFQLSFGVVGSMALVGPPLLCFWKRHTFPDPLIPDELRPPLWHRKRKALDWLGVNLSSSAAAWLGSCPLVWHIFHLFNPISLAANLVVIPLSSAALVAALASLLCGDWLPAVGEVFNASAWVWMTAMIRSSQAFAAIPAGWWHVAPIPIPFWITYYGLLLWFTHSTRLRPLWRWIRLCCLLTWIAAAGVWKAMDDARTRLVFLPGGGALWVDLPGVERDTLINGGDESTTRRITIPYLQAHGIDRIRHWFITQGQVQHIGGASLIQDSLQPQSISALEVLKSHLQSRSRGKLGTGDSKKVLWKKPEAEWMGWKVAHPPMPNGFRGLDDISGVLTGDFEGVRVLYCGNLGRRGQRALVERLGESLRADIVVSGIPNDGEPLIDALLEVVKPELILLLNSQYPVGRRGKPETFERLEAGGYRWMALSDAGTLIVEIAGGTCRVVAHKTGEQWTRRGLERVRAGAQGAGAHGPSLK